MATAAEPYNPDEDEALKAALDALRPELPPHGTVAADRARLRELYALLRKEGTLTKDRIRDYATDEWGLTIRSERTEFMYRVVPYLVLLPGIVSTGEGFTYAPDREPDPVDSPANPTHPSEDELEATLYDLDLPGPETMDDSIPPEVTNNRLNIRDVVEYLQDHHTATMAELMDLYEPIRGRGANREQGHYADPGLWTRDVLRPTLEDLPWIVTPPVAGGEVVYVGVDR